MNLAKRSSGVLMHLTSLPSGFGVGDLGPAAFRFADLLSESGQKYWQILPVNPVGLGNSPYNPRSVFAGNPLLVSPEVLNREGLLPDIPTHEEESPDSDRVHYNEVAAAKKEMLRKAYSRFKDAQDEKEFEEFCATSSGWLEDYSLFSALTDASGLPWYRWPKGLRDRNPEELRETGIKLRDAVDLEKYVQFEFDRQWRSLKAHCASIGVLLMGDVSFYVAHDSCDIWANREIFKVDGEGRPEFVGGVPPDYFSKTGQLWGNPVYDWDRLKAWGFSWWVKRIEQAMKLFDAVRLDHFRGFVAYWEIPGTAKTAESGRWVDVPWESFFETVRKGLPSMPFVAEDLGIITPDVREAMESLGLPGMNVLLFAFDSDQENPYLPEKYSANSVAYTGTHDTNTVRGWLRDEATSDQKKRLFDYIGRELPDEQANWEFISLAMTSVAGLTIIPAADVLGLGSEARMNRPSVSDGNWEWRATTEQLKSDSFRKLREFTLQCGRN